MAMSSTDPIDAARGAENFPVASFFLAPAMRAAVLSFYRVARGADDIADSTALDETAKTARLLALDAVLAGAEAPPGDALAADCARLRRTSIRHAADIVHARHLLQAFLADAQARPSANWSDLMAYCRYSAAPVGRFLLDLHGESRQAARASDALCAALQILNHLQDCRSDWVELRRCYLPTDWLAQAGLDPSALAARACTPPLRGVIDRVLDRVDALLADAAALPDLIAAPGLAREAAGILALARALARRLRREDPLARRVRLSRAGMAMRFLGAWLGRGAGRGGSSFALAIRLFAPRARRAVTAIYALARRLDDIADGEAQTEAKLAAFAAWRRALASNASDPGDEPLLDILATDAPGVPREEFLALIDGLEADSRPAFRAADIVALRAYCRQVAGSIGIMVLAATGLRGAADVAYAVALGEALQMVNILRDIDEDARRGRLYVPADMIRQAGLDPSGDAERLVADPRFAAVRASLLALCRSAFAAADESGAQTRATQILAVRLIAATYRRLLHRLAHAPQGSARLSLADRCSALAAALRGTA